MEGVLYMDFTTTAIKKTIEEKLDNGYKRFIIFPFGDVGIKAKEFLNSLYGIEEEMIIDNHLCKYNSNIKSIDILKEINTENITAILSTTDAQIYHELRNCLLKYFVMPISEIFTGKRKACFLQLIQKNRLNAGNIVMDH